MACEFWTRMGKRCSFGHRGRRVPRDPDGEDRVPSLIVCEAFFRAISAFIFHGWLRISWQEGPVRVRSIAVRADGLRCANHLSNHPSRVRRSLWRRVRCAATEKRKSRSRTRIRRNAVRHPHRSPSNSAPRTWPNTARSTSRRCLPPDSRLAAAVKVGCPLSPQKRTSEISSDYVRRSSSGSLAIFAAIRRVSSRVSNLRVGERTAELFDKGEGRHQIGEAPPIIVFAAPRFCA